MSAEIVKQAMWLAMGAVMGCLLLTGCAGRGGEEVRLPNMERALLLRADIEQRDWQ